MTTPCTIPAGYRPAADALEGRVVLVTGAGDGIGRAVAKALAAHGSTVVLLGRTVKKLESVYDEIASGGGPEPAIYPMDLLGAQPDDYLDLAENVERELGGLDGLLHNAALLGTLCPVENYDLGEWMRVQQVNVNAPFLMTRACLPLLRRSAQASIVFTSDALGRRGRAYWGAYGVSKFAVEGLMQLLADELEGTPTIRVNSLDPGAVRTMLRARAYPAEDPRNVPAPETVVAPFLYLLGPDVGDATGKAFTVSA